MDKVQVLELYGRSVYQIRLEVAMQLYVRAGGTEAGECLEAADNFVQELLDEERVGRELK